MPDPVVDATDISPHHSANFIGIDLKEKAPFTRTGFETVGLLSAKRLQTTDVDAAGGQLTFDHHVSLNLVGMTEYPMDATDVQILGFLPGIECFGVAVRGFAIHSEALDVPRLPFGKRPVDPALEINGLEASVFLKVARKSALRRPALDPEDPPLQTLCRIESPGLLLSVIEKLEEAGRGKDLFAKHSSCRGEVDLSDEGKRLIVRFRPRFTDRKARFPAQTGDPATATPRQ